MKKMFKIAAVITLALSAFVTPVMAEEPDLCAIAYMCPNCGAEMSVHEDFAILWDSNKERYYTQYYDVYGYVCGYSFRVPTVKMY